MCRRQVWVTVTGCSQSLDWLSFLLWKVMGRVPGSQEGLGNRIISEFSQRVQMKIPFRSRSGYGNKLAMVKATEGMGLFDCP